MSVYAATLIIISAFLHALWNAIAKKKASDIVSLWLSISLCMMALLLGMLLASPASLHLDAIRATLPFSILSASVHALYFLLLTKLYRREELSYLYPYARGSAVIITAIVGLALLGEAPSQMFIAGAILVALGILTIARYRERNYSWSHPLHGLFLGALITVAVVLDKAGLQAAGSLSYLLVLFVFTAIMLTPFGIHALSKQGNTLPSISALIGLGPAIILCYFLVLEALRYEDVSRVGSLREVSILFSSILGWFLFKESFPKDKLLAITLILTGILLVLCS